MMILIFFNFFVWVVLGCRGVEENVVRANRIASPRSETDLQR